MTPFLRLSPQTVGPDASAKPPLRYRIGRAIGTALALLVVTFVLGLATGLFFGGCQLGLRLLTK